MTDFKFDSRLFIDAVFVRWKLVFLVMLLLPTAALVSNEMAQRAYVASARLVIQENRSVAPFLGDMLVDLQVSNRFPVVANVLGSRTVTEQMLRELGEIDDSDTVADIDWSVERFQQALKIDNSGGGVIRIAIEGSTPEQALGRLQLILATLREEMLRPQRESLTASVEFLRLQVERVGADLAEGDDALRAFKEEHAEELPAVYEGNLERYLATLADLGDAESDLGVAEGDLRRSREQLSNYNSGVRELEAQLRTARARLTQLLGVYTEEHPDVAAARSQVRSLENDLEEARTSLIDDLPTGSTSIEVTGTGRARVIAGDMITAELLAYRESVRDVEALRYRVQRLRERRDELRDTVRAFAANEQQLGALMRNVEASQELFVNLSNSYEDARMTREVTLQTEASRFWIIEAPTLPPEVNRRSRKKVGIAAAMAAYMLVLCIVAVLEFLEPAVRTPTEATTIAGVPVIGSIPRFTDGA